MGYECLITYITFRVYIQVKLAFPIQVCLKV